MKNLQVLPFLFFFFVVASWPFVYYPFTDLDITHWVPIAKEVRVSAHIFTSANDQTHGPLLSWSAAFFSLVTPHSAYAYALFSILIGVLGVYWVYYFSKKIWADNKTGKTGEGVGKLAAFLLSTSIFAVYMARTPMYDLPATVFYFGFTGFYLLHVLGSVGQDAKRTNKYYWWALICVGLGVLNRFSIVMGLSGIYVLLVGLIYRRSLVKIFRDGLLVALSGCLFLAPWFVGQYVAHGQVFIHDFLADNMGRFFKEPQLDAPVYRDYYSFPLYVFVGFLPHSFALLMSIFQKGGLKRIKASKIYQAFLAGFLPCLILFSFSGHVKLGRYISYVFPMLTLYGAHMLYAFDLDNEKWRKRTLRMAAGTLVFIGLLLLILILQFKQQASEGLPFAFGLIGLLLSHIGYMYCLIKNKYADFKENSQKYLGFMALVYILFFTIVTYESFHANFLSGIRQQVDAIIK